ncbi:MAG: STAS domain-containing protein [Coriobacteriia bacterium]|nr:STAS domain-containing protein [Coriobacteriia bacterium]
MDLKIDQNCDTKECVLAIEGEIDVSNADTLRESLNGLLDKTQNDIVIIDMSKAPYIDSTGIGVLMGAAHLAKDKDIKLKVVIPHDNILRIFEMLGVDKELEIHKEPLF